MFAGLWEKWKPKEGEPIISYTIIVCAPNPMAAGYHDRMPVIIDEKDRERWFGDRSATLGESERSRAVAETVPD
jgi:putative SOS response-associated peptidase YedK